MAIIEIKLRRINGIYNRGFIKKIEEDIEKLKKIKNEISWNYPCYMVVLDKKKDIENAILKLTDIKLFYKFSNCNQQTKQNQRVK